VQEETRQLIVFEGPAVRLFVRLGLPVIFPLLLGVGPARGDVFVYRTEAGETVEVEARLAGSGQGALALETADGQFKIIAEGAVQKREPKDGPAPLDSASIESSLEKQFGEDLFRSQVKEPYVIGLVLGSPLPKSYENRAKGFLTKVAGFFKNVDSAFAAFVKEARIPAKPPTHPLVVLIFETEAGFEKYSESVSSGKGLAAARLAGFYSGITNHLAIRLAECKSFDVPLHEAIHQQVYNRNVFQRLAPIPRWFDEGIAAGFEGNQGKVSIGPTKISARYARQVTAARQLTFEKILNDDDGFFGDVLVGEAYGGAWGLHWLLVTKYRSQYGKYVRLLSEKEALHKEEPEQRVADFLEAFGKSPADIDKEFRPTLDAGIKKQKVTLNPEKPPGFSFTQESMGEVELTAVDRGRLEVQGKLTNVSPFRPMAFYVTVETDAGTYAGWHVPNLDVQKSTNLDLQLVTKRMQGARGGPARGFRVRIRSVPPESNEANAWKNGQLPIPEA
jgi:hypothetical protein